MWLIYVTDVLGKAITDSFIVMFCQCKLDLFKKYLVPCMQRTIVQSRNIYSSIFETKSSDWVHGIHTVRKGPNRDHWVELEFLHALEVFWMTVILRSAWRSIQVSLLRVRTCSGKREDGKYDRLWLDRLVQRGVIFPPWHSPIVVKEEFKSYVWLGGCQLYLVSLEFSWRGCYWTTEGRKVQFRVKESKQSIEKL